MSEKDSLVEFELTDKTPSTRFLASLSDGRTVIQDSRDGERHAWTRLSEWLNSNPSISITGLRLQNCLKKDCIVTMPPGQSGYFFGNKSRAVWNGPIESYVGIGYYNGEETTITWHRNPLFDASYTEKRTKEKSGFFLIVNCRGN